MSMAFHGAQRQVEFDFVVAPGANPAPIGFRFTGAQSLKTDDSGNLVIASAAGNVLLHRPVAYQEQNGARQLVDAQFVLRANNQISFELGNYDRSRELVIDPSVSYAYSTYLGGYRANDEGYGIAFDKQRATILAMSERDKPHPRNFPPIGGVPPNAASLRVRLLTCLSRSSPQTAQALVYSTYVGGTHSDSGNGIALDASGNAFVAGGTSSTIDFPATSGAFQTAPKSGATQNAFVFKLGSSRQPLALYCHLSRRQRCRRCSRHRRWSHRRHGCGRRLCGGWINVPPQTFPLSGMSTALQPTLAGTSNGFVTRS